MPRILIVEDEPDIVTGLQEDLKRQGYTTEVARDGAEALARGKAEAWDVILLDVMLPTMDGFDVCAGLRRAGIATPIILLTARTHEADKEVGLDSGADDYVTKPFSLRELRARIRAQLRRHATGTFKQLTIGHCKIDFDRAEIVRGDERVELTARELRLLEVFARNPGRVLSREQLIEGAWSAGIAVTDRVVDTQMFNLRKKLEPTPAEPRYLVGVRGLGYRFDP
jgi:two-component system alkaline phosphatase synthesis response regulator PhoP